MAPNHVTPRIDLAVVCPLCGIVGPHIHTPPVITRKAEFLANAMAGLNAYLANAPEHGTFTINPETMTFDIVIARRPIVPT